MNHCPTCAGPVPDDTIWLLGQKFYCSENCCYQGSKKSP